MDVLWMIAVLEATLFVVAASLAAAVTADAISRRGQLPDRAESASRSQPRSLTVEAGDRVRNWPRIAVRAWAVCTTASALVVAAIGLLLIVG